MTYSTPSPAPRLAGLDGLRAIAVGLVVIYHLFPGWVLQGGFVGVDVFFVISGFLITTLLLREHAAEGRIRLGRFWQRRARRLLPALALLVTVCATAAWVIGGDVLVRLGEQVLGAVTFSYNWVSIAGGTGYFTGATPELFRNLWSLAVEEQFYVLWPLILPLFLLLPRGTARAVVALALAVASAVWMGMLVTSGADLTRVYFGTDTHAFGILLGVALAFALQRTLSTPPGWTARRSWRVAGLVLGAGAVAGLVAVSTLPAQPDAFTFPGATAAASVLTAVAIIAGVLPGSWFGRAIDAQPLRWIGDRSYGIYLWHWPLLVLLVAALQGSSSVAGAPVWIGLLALVLTIAIAELSYRFLEMPVRRYGFRGSLARLGQRVSGPPLTRLRALSAITATVIVLGGTSAAIAAAPDVASGQAVVEAGAAALAEASDTAAPAPSTPAPVPSGFPSPAPSPTDVPGTDITAIGDSVMLASAPALLDRFPGIQVDAAVSRSMWAGPGIAQTLADGGQLRPFVVVALGTNGAVDPESLDKLLAVVGRDRGLILVNAFAPRSWVPEVNADLAAFAASHSGVVLADWAGAIGGRTDLLAGDQIHPGDAGGRVFADAVADAVDTAEAERAERQYRADLRAYRLTNGMVAPVPQ
ncbi:acyltransferase [Microbacterium sp. Root61]|uniref:acyltransferase family protein n=1 Tax=Microbacterium sp. Root61 TaxID=1736570 RepID=UPI0006F5DA5C|nr:acyltransferase family protein [Microbacterium sp. Root61]KRA25670.1 acyltransferase [Microbacterium sp. Root61]